MAVPEWAKPLNSSAPIVPGWAKPIEKQHDGKGLSQRQVMAESGGKDFDDSGDLLTSPKGALGRNQVMPGTITDPGFGVRPADKKILSSGNKQAIADEIARVGNDYMDAMRKRYNGNEELALAAYNAGPGAVDRAGGIPDYKETKAYVAKSAPEYMRDDLKKAPWLDRQLVGVGGAMVGGWEGLKDIFGQSNPQDVEFTRVAQQEAPIGSFVGNVAMLAPTMAIPGVNTVQGAAATGGIYNALTTPGNIEERKNSAILGLIAGGAGQGFSNALGRMFSRGTIPVAKNALVREGITLTPGQNAGGVFKSLEDKATSIPIVGEIINNARRRGIEEFNEAAIKRATLPGMDVDGIGNPAMQEIRLGLSDAYENVLSSASVPGFDNQFMKNMVSLGEAVSSLPAQEANTFKNIINREIVERMAPNGQINGENIKGVMSALENEASMFSRSNDAYQRKLGDALRQASVEFKDMVARANPNLSNKIREIDTAYAHFKRLQNAASGVGAEGGIFTPAQLHRAAKAGDRTKDKRAFSEGAALYQDLTSAGKSVMPSRVPDSGTAGRLMSNIFSLKGLAGMAGGTAGALPTMALYSKTGSRAANALYDSMLNMNNPNALRLILNPVLTQQLE